MEKLVKEQSISFIKGYEERTGIKMVISQVLKEKFKKWDWWKEIKDYVEVSKRPNPNNSR